MLFKHSPLVYEYKKSNRMCFLYRDTYNVGQCNVGNQCRPKQLNWLIGKVKTGEEVSSEVEDPSYTILSIEGEIEQEVQEAVWLNAFTGNNQGVNTILVSGTLKNTSLTLLIDSGSTHNFVDQHTITKAGY